MGNRFVFWYSFFFVYIFPLIFSYVGLWGWNATWATLSVVVGLTGWCWYITWLYKRYIREPRLLRDEARRVHEEGKLVDAKIVDIVSRKENSRGEVDYELKLSFPNLAGTPVSVNFELTDSQPHLRRFEIGKDISMRLNTQTEAKVPLTIDGGEIEMVASPHRWLIPFTVLYAVATFLIMYAIYSDGKGWRWVTLYNPWVCTPFWGYSIYRTISGLAGKFGRDKTKKGLYNLLLHGIETTGKITKVSQTGLYLNEQPEVKLLMSYMDLHGTTHYVEQKKIVLLSDMHRYQLGEAKLLYLPSNPQMVELLI